MKSYWLAIAAVFAVAAPLALFGLCPLGFDALPFFLPLTRLAAHLAPSLDLIWTNRLGTGYPLLASLQVPVAYPLFWPLLALKDPTFLLPSYLTLHLLIACVGGCRLGRINGLSKPAAAVLGALCGAAAPVACLVNRPEFCAAAAWMPWLYAGVMQPKVRTRWLQICLPLGACLLVSPQMALFAGGLALVVAFLPQRRKAVIAMHEVALIGLGVIAISAPLLLPFLEFLLWSDRIGSGALRTPAQFSVPGAELLSLLAPSAMGLCEATWSLSSLDCSQLPMVALSLWLPSLVSGVVGLSVGLYGLMRHRRFRPLALVVFGALLLAMPSLIPGVSWLWTVPPLGLLRFPAKIWSAAWPLAALIIVSGLAPLRQKPRPFALAMGITSVIAAALSLLPDDGWAHVIAALGGGPNAMVATVQTHIAFSLRQSAALCAVAACLCLGLKRRRLVVALALLVGAEAAVLGAATIDGVRPQDQGQNVVGTTIKDQTVGPNPRISQLWTYNNPVLLKTSMPRDTRALLESAMGGNNVLLGEHIALQEAFTGIDLNTYGPLAAALMGNPASRATLFGSQALLIGSAYDPGPRWHQANDWPVAGVPLFLPNIVPSRFQVASLTKVFDSKLALLRALAVQPEDELATALVLQSDATALSPPLPMLGPSRAQVQITQDEARRVSARVETDQAALVWTRDTLGPGWTVTVDEQPGTIVPVFSALRGVVVPAGVHQVSWQYHPTSFLWGCLLSLAALAMAACLLVFARLNASALKTKDLRRVAGTILGTSDANP